MYKRQVQELAARARAARDLNQSEGTIRSEIIDAVASGPRPSSQLWDRESAQRMPSRVGVTGKVVPTLARSAVFGSGDPPPSLSHQRPHWFPKD